MNEYELMLVFKPDIDAKDVEKRDNIVKKLLTGAKYTVKDITTIGKKTLAYPIKHQAEGLYVLCHLTADSLHVSDIETQGKIGGDVLRFLLTRQS